MRGVLCLVCLLATTHALAVSKPGANLHIGDNVPTEKVSRAMDAVNLLKNKLLASKHSLSAQDYMRYQSNLRTVTHDIHMLQEIDSSLAQHDLTAEIKKHMGTIRSMADKLEATKLGAKVATHKPAAKKVMRDLEQTAAPAPAAVVPKPMSAGEKMVAEARELLHHATDTVDKANLVGSMAEEMKSNLAHMSTDLDMMASTANEEAIADLYQALRMRNDKVVELELGMPKPEAKVSPMMTATVQSVQRLIADLEESAVAKTRPGHDSLATLRENVASYESAQSDNQRAEIAEKMQSIVADLQRQSAELEEEPETVHDQEEEEEEEGGEDKDDGDQAKVMDQEEEEEEEDAGLGGDPADANAQGEEEARVPTESNSSPQEEASGENKLEEEEEEEEEEAGEEDAGADSGGATEAASDTKAADSNNELEEEEEGDAEDEDASADEPALEEEAESSGRKVQMSFFNTGTGKFQVDVLPANDHDLDGLMTSERDLEQVDIDRADSLLALHSEIYDLYSKLRRDVHKTHISPVNQQHLLLNVEHIHRDLERIVSSRDPEEQDRLTEAVKIRVEDSYERLKFGV